MILIAVVALTYQPVAAVAEVTTSNGKRYRVETCFRTPGDLRTRFIYPDRSTNLELRGGRVTVEQAGEPPAAGGEAEKRFAFGHNFHALALNAARWPSSGAVRTLPHGGTMRILRSRRGVPREVRLESPDTSPVTLRFSDWRGIGRGLPFRLMLEHGGVTYDYRFTAIDRRCALN